jgi:outer membrane protein TolC
MAGLVLQVPLFDGLEAHSKVGQAEAQRLQAELGVQQTRDLVRSEVRQRRAQIDARLGELAYARAREAERREKVRAADQGFAAGTTNRSEQLTAHLEWSDARTRALLALYLVHLAHLELEHAAGGLPRSVDEVGP